MNAPGYSRRDFVRLAGLGAVGWALWRLAATSESAPSNKPNIVFILADDLGWAELGCYGNTFNETPNLAAKNPEKAAELVGLLAQWRKEVGAVIPRGQHGSEEQ